MYNHCCLVFVHVQSGYMYHCCLVFVHVQSGYLYNNCCLVSVRTQSGYIYNKGMPQLCLGVSDTRIEGRLFTRETPVNGLAVALQKRMTGNPNQIWRFAPSGGISVEVREEGGVRFFVCFYFS